MTLKAIAILSGVILALVAVIGIMARIIKSKNKKIKTLETSARAQQEIISSTDSEKKEAESKKNQLSKGTDLDKFNVSMDILRKMREKNKEDKK